MAYLPCRMQWKFVNYFKHAEDDLKKSMHVRMLEPSVTVPNWTILKYLNTLFNDDKYTHKDKYTNIRSIKYIL